MKKYLKKSFLILFFLFSFFFLLTASKECILFSSKGLQLWFEKMIPTLFPFMVLSGCIVRSGLSLKLGELAAPLLFCFRITAPMRYALIMGFFCGFPMGAKVIADLLETGQITKKQGEFLLAFTNNIGPLYLISYVFPLFPGINQKEDKIYFLLLFYLVPFFYGLLLRYLTPEKKNYRFSPCKADSGHFSPLPFGSSFYQSLSSALEQITLLGGCMVIFNWLQIFPFRLQQMGNRMFPDSGLFLFFYPFLCSLAEIGGGILEFSYLDGILPSFCLFPLVFSLLTFGGISCIFQTWFIIEKTGLSLKKYIFHKTFQALILYFLIKAALVCPQIFK